MTRSSKNERQAVLAKFHELTKKLAQSDDAEIRTIYKGRLEELVPQLIALGVTRQNVVEGNTGIVIQENSEVRDVIQQIIIQLPNSSHNTIDRHSLSRRALIALVMLIIVGVIILAVRLSQNSNQSSCEVSVSDIASSKRVISVGEKAELAVTTSQTTLQAANYSWQTISGNVNPAVGTNSNKTTYTGPLVPTNDTVKLTVNVTGCAAIERTIQLMIVQ